jgi:hypothetical protein
VTAPPPDPTLLGRVRRSLRPLARLRSPSPRVRAVLLVVAIVAVTVGLIVAVRELDVRPADLRWGPLAAAALLVSPLTVALNAAELRWAAAIVAPPGRSLAWRPALRTVVIATAANLLPLPAGALVRVEAVTRTGATIGAATAVNVVAAGLWVSAGIGLAAGAVLGTRPTAGAIGLAVALTGVAVSTLLCAKVGRGAWRGGLLRLGAVELTTALLHAARLVLVLAAVGIEVTAVQGLVLGGAAPLAAAAGVFPSGIGLAEALTAVLAPAAGLPAAAGLLASTLGRVVGLTATVVIALALGAGTVRAGLGAAREKAARQAGATDTPEDAGVSSPGATDA